MRKGKKNCSVSFVAVFTSCLPLWKFSNIINIEI